MRYKMRVARPTCDSGLSDSTIAVRESTVGCCIMSILFSTTKSAHLRGTAQHTRQRTNLGLQRWRTCSTAQRSTGNAQFWNREVSASAVQHSTGSLGNQLAQEGGLGLPYMGCHVIKSI